MKVGNDARTATKTNFKRTLARQQYQSQIKIFFDLCLHQQLKFDISVYIVHAERFVCFFTEFPAGHHIEMCVAVQVSTFYRNNSIERVEVWHCNATTSLFKMVARRKFSDQNKLLGVNYIHRIIQFGLLVQTQVKENSYLR